MFIVQSKPSDIEAKSKYTRLQPSLSLIELKKKERITAGNGWEEKPQRLTISLHVSQ